MAAATIASDLIATPGRCDCAMPQTIHLLLCSEFRWFGAPEAAGAADPHDLHLPLRLPLEISTCRPGRLRRSSWDSGRPIEHRAIRASPGPAGSTGSSRRPGAMYSLIREHIKPIPILGPASGSVVRGMRGSRPDGLRFAILIDHRSATSSGSQGLAIAWRDQGYRGFRDELASRLPAPRPEPSRPRTGSRTRPSA